MLRSRYCCCVLCGLLGVALAYLLLFGASAPAAAQAPKSGPVSFINDIAPIFKENCFACHDAKKRKGKLDMTTYENLRKGGDNEDPIEPGKVEDSFINDLITSAGNNRMPPKESGDPLPKEKIALIQQWIKEGAKLDTGIDPKADLGRELRVRWKPPAPPASYKYPVIINALVFTPDSKKVIVGGHHELTIWDAAEGKLEKRIHTRAERAYAMAFLPDGKLVVAGGRPGQEGDVRVYDINGGKPKMENGVAVLDGVNDKAVMLAQLLDTDDSVLCLALTPDGKKLAAGGCDRLVRIWDLSPGVAKAKLEQTIENHADWVFGAALSADGKYVLTASRDKTAKVWDLMAKESVLTFPGHQQNVYGVAVSPDGKIGYSAGEDNQIRSWNAVTDGKQLRASTGHGKAVVKVVRHPTQALLITASADNSARVWNADTGAAVRTLPAHADQVFAVAVSPDGNLVASGSYDGEVKISKLADGALAKAFNASPGFTPATAAEPKK
jgi:WD40 repeat protein